MRKDYIYLFDLDSTISEIEILPSIAEKIGLKDEMRDLTEATMRGEIPFKTSFLNRVKLLNSVNVTDVNRLVSEIPINKNIANFIRENKNRCYIVTGNLDVWISGLMRKLGVENNVFCSKALVKDNRILEVISVADKELISKQFVKKYIAVGDGDNDAGMAKYADIAVGYGGVREIAPSLFRNIDYAFYDGEKCAEFLKHTLKL